MKNSKFRVIPGLSLKGDELKRRLANKSLSIDTSGQVFNADKAVEQTLRMSRADLARTYLTDRERTRDLEKKIRETDLKAKQMIDAERDKAIYEKAKAEALRELQKEGK